MEKFISKIREFREKKELTQEQLAKQIGTTRQTVIALEQGRFLPSLGLAFKFAIFFGVKIEDIFEINNKQ